MKILLEDIFKKLAIRINRNTKIIIGNLIIISIFLSTCINYSYAQDSAVEYAKTGFAYMEKGLFDKAKEEFKKALQIDPNDYVGHYGMGLVYSNKSMLDDAIASYKKAIAITPDFARAYIHLGIDYAAKGMLEEAASAYEKAVALNPAFKDSEYFSNVYFALGFQHKKKGMLDEAILAYKKAIEINPKDYEACVNLGILYFDKRLFKEAIQHYEKAIEINPKNPIAYNNLGNAYFASALIEKATENYKKTIQLAPDSDAANRARKSLDDLALAQQRLKTNDGLDNLGKSVTGNVISYYLHADENNPGEEILKIVDLKKKELLLQTQRKYLVGYEVKLMSAIMDNNLEQAKEIIEQAKAEYYKKYNYTRPKEKINLLSERRYINKDLGFSVMPPEGWEIEESRGQVLISKPFDVFGSNIYIIIDASPNRKNLSLAELKKEFIEKINKTVTPDKDYQIKILRDEEVIFAGIPAFKQVYETIDAGSISSIETIGFVKENKRYFIQYISEVSPYEFKKYSSVFEKSMETFKIE